MDELLQAHAENKEETRFYEVGYHLVPTVSEESLAGEALRIKDQIAALGGTAGSEGMPQKAALAYRIPQMKEGQRTFFDSSYFGWVRFEMPRENIATFERALKENATVLRFLVLQVKKQEAVSHPVHKMPFFGGKVTPKGRSPIAEESRREEKTAGGALSEAELDKTIEELIAE